ncbi:MAG: phage portal protein [Anaerolineales bacterium]|nr:phage portal protein [Anaerolineales bacterium]
MKRIPNQHAAWLLANLRFYNGDHWQEGTGWTGPTVPETHTQYGHTMQLLEKIFVSRNSIAQAVNQHVAGVLGNPPRWTITGGDDALMQEAEMLLTTWLANQQGYAARTLSKETKLCSPLEVVNLATKHALLTTRGGLRFFVANPDSAEAAQNEPASADTNQYNLPILPAEEAINQIFIHNPDPRQAAVFVDENTMTTVGLYTYQEDKVQKAELSYIGRDGNTILLILDETGIESGAKLPLGRRLMHYEIERPLFITEQIRAAQKALNKAETMTSKNLDVGGFLERVFLNAQPPGTWEKNSQTGIEEFKPLPLEIGPGLTTFISGMEEARPDGSRTYATPSALFREPTNPEAFTDTSDHYHASILEQCGQLHTLLANEGNISGESRSQARDAYKKSLLETKPEADKALVWLLETVLALTAVLSGQPGRYEALAVSVDCQLDLGIITSDEVTQTVQAHGAGLLSRETAMSKIGVTDPTAEKQRIQDEQVELNNMASNDNDTEM